MKKPIKSPAQMIGVAVESVLIEVFFFNAEQQGNLGNLIVKFADNRRYSLGCRGDGGIFVAFLKDHEPVAPPDFVIETRLLGGLHGFIQTVETTRTSVMFEIGGQKLKVENADDELVVTRDGVSLSWDYFVR